MVYAYGLLALTVIDDRCPGFFRDQRGIRYSMPNSPDAPPGKKRVDTYWVPELGKNIVPLKVWIPRRLKDDLTTLAEHAGLPLSQFVREIVIARLLGHGTLPARPLLTRAEPTAADAWCEDREVPWRQASADEYWRIGEGEVRWHYEDATDEADAVP